MTARRPPRRPRPARRTFRHAPLAAPMVLAAGIAAGLAAPPAASAQPGSAPEAPAWDIVLGGFGGLEDVVARGTDDVWAVGDGIVRWDGVEWRQALPGPRPRLRAIDALPDGSMWAVGTRGQGGCDAGPVALRFDGDAWLEEPVETHQPLWDVHMTAPDDGWAVGGIERPVILRYDGARWRPFAEPEIGPLRAVDLVAPDDGWAVGLDGALARWDGRDWRAVPPPRQGIDLHDVVLVDEGLGWAVGAGIDPRAGVVLALRDGAWSIALLDRSPLLAAVVAPARDVALAVGRFGTLLRWDGTAWRDFGRTYPGGFVPTGDPRPPSGEALVPGLPPDASARPIGWRVRGDRSPAAPPAPQDPYAPRGPYDPYDLCDLCDLYDQYDPSDPQRPHAPSAPAAPHAPSAPAQRDDPYAWRWRAEVLAEPVYLRGLAVLVDAEAMVAVGDAGQVVVVEAPFYQEVHAGRPLGAIDMLPDGGEGWIVGPDGPPLRWDGAAWRPEPGPIELTWMRDVEAVAPGVAWAVGDAGTVLRFEQGRWARVPFPTADDLVEVSFGDADDGWTYVNTFTESGYETRVYRWNGTAWREAIHLCGGLVSGVAADGRGGAWFAAPSAYGGDGARAGSLLRFDGRSWWWVPILGARDPRGPVSPPTQIGLASDGSGWATGSGLARLDGASWRSLTDAARLADWRDPVRAIYVEAVAARDRSAFWGLLPNYRWTEDDTASGTGTWVAWFAPGPGFDPFEPDGALGHAHLSTTRLHDLAITRGADGATEVWAVGDGATILRHRQLEPAGIPAATATAPAPPAGGWPTPTPHAVLGREAAVAFARDLFPPEDADRPLVVARAELVDRAGALARWRDAGTRYDRGGGWWWTKGTGLDPYYQGNLACLPGWLPWWWIELRGATGNGCNVVVGAVDAVDGANAELLCAQPFGIVYLPFAQTRRSGPVEPTNTPRPSATPRSLTPVAAANVDGPCPTPTPWPTRESWPYP